MGCATSKQTVCRKCKEPYSSVRRSYSLHSYRRRQKERDKYHPFALTSSALGSVTLDLLDQNRLIKEEEDEEEVAASNPIEKGDGNDPRKLRDEEFAMGVIEAKTWSKMIDEKIPKVAPVTPIRTPPGEPETINAWELMEGLEDTSPLRPAHHNFRSFSFHVGSNKFRYFLDGQPTPRIHENGEATTKPTWLERADSDSNSNSNDTSIVSEFDPEVISTFRKALEELPAANPFHLKPLISEKHQSFGGKDEALELADPHVKEINGSAPRGKDRLILYFTSLRGVRKTYEDCSNVRVILKGLGVKVDERDLSIHSGFKEELKDLLGENWSSKGALPKVFVGRKFLGGAEEIRQMHEENRLEKAVASCQLVGDEGGGIGGVCEACGDVRFVPCETCFGSRKIYYECDYDEDEESEEAAYGFQRCPDCNENGLILCPFCW